MQPDEMRNPMGFFCVCRVSCVRLGLWSWGWFELSFVFSTRIVFWVLHTEIILNYLKSVGLMCTFLCLSLAALKNPHAHGNQVDAHGMLLPDHGCAKAGTFRHLPYDLFIAKWHAWNREKAYWLIATVGFFLALVWQFGKQNSVDPFDAWRLMYRPVEDASPDPLAYVSWRRITLAEAFPGDESFQMFQVSNWHAWGVQSTAITAKCCQSRPLIMMCTDKF